MRATRAILWVLVASAVVASLFAQQNGVRYGAALIGLAALGALVYERRWNARRCSRCSAPLVDDAERCSRCGGGFVGEMPEIPQPLDGSIARVRGDDGELWIAVIGRASQVASIRFAPSGRTLEERIFATADDAARALALEFPDQISRWEGLPPDTSDLAALVRTLSSDPVALASERLPTLLAATVGGRWRRSETGSVVGVDDPIGFAISDGADHTGTNPSPYLVHLHVSAGIQDRHGTPLLLPDCASGFGVDRVAAVDFALRNWMQTGRVLLSGLRQRPTDDVMDLRSGSPGGIAGWHALASLLHTYGQDPSAAFNEILDAPGGLVPLVAGSLPSFERDEFNHLKLFIAIQNGEVSDCEVVANGVRLEAASAALANAPWPTEPIFVSIRQAVLLLHRA